MAATRKAGRTVPNVRGYLSQRVYNGKRVKTGGSAVTQVCRTATAVAAAKKRAKRPALTHA